jgi:molybdenum cofactor sulfurtransferase
MQTKRLHDCCAYDVERIRAEEYPQLKGRTYMDHTGTTLYARSLITEFAADMTTNLYGNPHSESTLSVSSSHRIQVVRERTLRFVNADPEQFDLVFVANASAAIKLVYEAFRDYGDTDDVWFGYHKDSHNSIIGIREAFHMHRCFVTDSEVECWIDSGGYPGGPGLNDIGLFAYPAQSNMTGRRLPLDWSRRIRETVRKRPVFTVLDAAAYASTAPMDLSIGDDAPDFIPLSFYKIFGFPNLGALIVRKSQGVLEIMNRRRYFAGG